MKLRGHFKFENMTVILTVFLSDVAEQYGDFQRKTLEYFKQILHFKKTKLHKLICSCLTVQPSLSLFLSIQVMLYHETGGETSQRKRESAKEVVCEGAGSKR